MSTRNYGLPTVDPDTRLDFVNAVNGLAVSTDAVLHGVAASFPKDAFDLPVATTETLGGVRVGEGFKVYSDGLLTTAAERFELKAATETTLGGVAIGSNVTDDEHGTIGIGIGAFGDIEANEKTLARGSVTTPKLQDNAVTVDQVDSIVLNNLKGPAALWKNAQLTEQADPTGSLKWYVVKLSDKVKIVIPYEILLVFPTTLTSFDMPDVPGKYGGGKALVRFAALDTDTSKTYSVSPEANFALEFNFDDNKVYVRDYGGNTGESYYLRIKDDPFTTPGIIITD